MKKLLLGTLLFTVLFASCTKEAAVVDYNIQGKWYCESLRYNAYNADGALQSSELYKTATDNWVILLDLREDGTYYINEEMLGLQGMYTIGKDKEKFEN